MALYLKCLINKNALLQTVFCDFSQEEELHRNSKMTQGLKTLPYRYMTFL